MTLTPGTRLGPYEILSSLGAGGMGEVYRARDDRLHRFVALKFLPVGPDDDSTARKQLLHEARAAAALDHPYVCKVHEVGEVNGRPFIAMECISGETLKARIAREPLRFRDAVRVAIEMAEALDSAHARGVVHRDLKPSNVMLSEDGHVKILDFGVAIRLKETTLGHERTQTAASPESADAGTVAYMAPERLRGQPADARSDLFSFGVVLYEMLTGVQPFQRATTLLTARAILDESPAPWPLRAAPPVLLQHIVRKAIAKNPVERYQSVHDLLTDLRAVVAEAEDSQHGLGTGSAVPTPRVHARRSWRLAATVIATLVLGASVALVWGVLRRHDLDVPIEPTHMQVTLVGNVTVAELSPDGRTIAYVAGDRDESRLIVQDAGGGTAIEISRGRGPIRPPRWSPDGSLLAFSSYNGALNVVPRLGGHPRQLATVAFYAWAPDGSRLAVANPDSGGFKIISAGTGAILDTVQLSQLSMVRGLDWDRTSGRVALLERDSSGSSAIWVLTSDGKQAHRLYSDTNALRTPRWGSAGDVIYCLRTRNDAAEVVRLDVSSAVHVRPLVLVSGLSAEAGADLSVSADASRLLHVRIQESSNLALFDLRRPDAPPTLLTRGTGVFTEPRVSVDGSWIAAAARRGSNASIVKVPISGGSPTPLTLGDHQDGGPAWSPDGKQIAFASKRSGTLGLWTMTADGQRQVQLQAAALSPNLAVTWLPDGRIAWQQVTAGRRMNYRIQDLATRGEEFLVSEQAGGWLFNPRFSPRGDHVAVFWNRADRKQGLGLWIISWPGRAERFVKEGLYPISWSPDGEWIYAFDGDGVVWSVPRRNGSPRIAVRLPTGDLRGCDGTPDGRYIVCSVADRKADAWLIENFDPRVKRD